MPLQRLTPRDTGPDRATCQLIRDRAGDRCEVCGTALHGRGSRQHRQRRGMGGTRLDRANHASNLLQVCGDGTRGCHGYIEAHPREARANGWAVSVSADPTKVPVRLHDGRDVLLTNDGLYVVLEVTM